jgi:hypothetical protein
MRENPAYRPLHGALHDPPENDDAGKADRGVCRKLRARQFERRDRRSQRRHRVGMLVEFLRERGNRRTIFEVPAVAKLPIFFGSASQISERQVLLVSPSSVLWRLVSCCGCCERFGLRRRRAICAAPAPGAAAAGFPRFWEVVPETATSMRRRKILPSTADRDMPPRRSPIAAAVSPAPQSLRNKSMRSVVHRIGSPRRVSCAPRRPIVLAGQFLCRCFRYIVTYLATVKSPIWKLAGQNRIGDNPAWHGGPERRGR